MSVKNDDYFATARDFLRGQGNGCITSIWELLDELSDKLGDRFQVSPDTYKLLDLVETLWADPHVDQVPNTGAIEFAWNWRVSSMRPST